MIKVFSARGFSGLWLGSTASGLATWGLPFILGIAVTQGALSAVDLGIALALRTAGFLAILPISGVLADRDAKRKVVMWASIAAAIAIPIIALGLNIDGVSGLVIMSIGAVIAGAGQGACRPSYQGLVPLVVQDDLLRQANAAMSVSVRVTNLLGPAMATGIAIVLGLNAALLALLILWLLSAFSPPWPQEGNGEAREIAVGSNVLGRFWGDTMDGMREAKRHPWFMSGLFALTAVIAFGYSVASVVVPILSVDYYGGTLLLAGSATAYTAGALFGALIISKISEQFPGWVALGGLAAYSMVPLSLAIQLPIFVPLAAFFIAGIGIEFFNVVWFTAIQREVPKDKLARVSSIDFLFSYGLAPLGLSLIVPMIDMFGNGIVLGACAAICLLVPGLALLEKSSKTFSQKQA